MCTVRAAVMAKKPRATEGWIYEYRQLQQCITIICSRACSGQVGVKEVAYRVGLLPRAM